MGIHKIDICPLRNDRGINCFESADMKTAPCERCGWNPKNVELRRRRIEAALEKCRKLQKQKGIIK